MHWGDGSAPDTYSSGGVVTHTYADGPATPTITVDLVDEDDTHTGAGSKSITVNNVVPTIALSGAASVERGIELLADPGHDHRPGPGHGDELDRALGRRSAPDTYASGGVVTHTYADGPATPTITVDLVDEDGTHTGAGSKSITVEQRGADDRPLRGGRGRRGLELLADPGHDHRPGRRHGDELDRALGRRLGPGHVLLRRSGDAYLCRRAGHADDHGRPGGRGRHAHRRRLEVDHGEQRRSRC